NLGNALREQGKSAEAERCYREALRLRPAYAEAHNNLGNLFRDQRDIPAARACYEEAVRLRPDFTEARNNLGACLIEEGRSAEAVPHFREVLRQKPGYVAVLGNLGTLCRDGYYRFTDEETATVRALLAADNLSLEERSILTYALANVLDKQKAHD